MSSDFSESVSIITGASSGIGRAFALALASRQGRIALAARNEAALQQVACEVQERGGEPLVAPTDVTHNQEVVRLVSQTLERWGRIDILILSAGAYVRGPITSLTEADLQRALEVNYLGAARVVLAALPHMLPQASGHIVLVSSMDGRKGLPLDAPYVASKFALRGFGDVLRQELHGTGIRVTTVCPGRVDTPMIADLEVPRISGVISPEQVVKATLRAMRRGQSEVIVPFQARLLDWVNILSPRLADAAIRALRLEGWPREDTTKRP